MVDHGIVIDYASTDNSLDIVRELAPDWEIRPSCNKWFVEPDIGAEVMRIERGIKGWKMVLNITEFLLYHDIKGYCKELDEQGRKAILATGVIMVDRPTERSEYTDEPLVLQKTVGYFEGDVYEKMSTTLLDAASRSRLLHCYEDGNYMDGRHVSGRCGVRDPELFLCWFGWAPFDHVKGRKLQIQHKAPESQKRRWDWKRLYCIDGDDLEKMYEHEHTRSYDLLENDTYREAYENFKNAYSS